MSQTSYENLVDIVTSDKGTGTAAYQAINQASLSDLRQLTEEYDLDAIAETFPQPSDGAALATTAQIRLDKLDRNPDLFKAANGYYCDAESRLRAVKDCDDPELLQDALQSQSLQKTVRTAIERRLKKLSATQILGLKSQPSKDPEVMPPDEPSKAHADALQSIGKSISDEQIAQSLAAADQAAHDYLTQCLLAGATLCAAKAATPHGEWQSRIEAVCKNDTRVVFDISIREAQRYMKLWRHFVADLDAGEVIPFASQKDADQLQDALLALPHSESVLARDRVAPAITAWIGEEGSIRGLLDRIGRAEREVDREEDAAGKDFTPPPGATPPNIQTTFMDALFDDRKGIVTRLRHTLHSDVYTTLPKSTWQTLFGEIEPLYRLAKERAGF